MAKFIALVGAQTATNVQVKQRAAKLEFVFTTPEANAASWALLLAQMNAVIVSVDLQNKAGSTETLVPKISLGTLAEMYSANEGIINAVDTGANYEVTFSVELGVEGALQMDSETNIVVNITGMVANDALDVYAVDFPTVDTKAIKTNVIRFSANAAQTIGLQTGTILHLPKASFDKLELHYPNGRVVTLEKKELEGWCIEGNQQMGSLNGVVTNGFLNHYSVNVFDAHMAKVTQTADVNGYVFTHVAAAV